MITIHFTQCDSRLPMDEFHRRAMTLPVIPRIEYYFKLLRVAAYDHEEESNFSTTDELLLLVAQKLVRDDELDIQFKSYCGCPNSHHFSTTTIKLSNDGDMIQDPHHGFFPQRLPLLR